MTVVRTGSIVALLFALALPADGRGACCARCGCTAEGLCVVYRPVRTTMLVEYEAWDCVGEELAVPRRCLLPAKHGDEASRDAPGCCRVGCATYCRNKLVKKKFVREVPVVKCVAEYVCERCREASPGRPPERPPRCMPWLNILLEKASLK